MNELPLYKYTRCSETATLNPSHQTISAWKAIRAWLLRDEQDKSVMPVPFREVGTIPGYFHSDKPY